MAPVLSKVITSVLQDKVADEPMVDEKLGQFSAIEIPVQRTQVQHIGAYHHLIYLM